MSATRTTIENDIAGYAAAVRDALSDLPAAAREEITCDLEVHLGEVAGENGGLLSSRLGPPGQYAAELRSSAGLPPPRLPAPVRLLFRARADITHLTVQCRSGWRSAIPLGWWLLRGALAAVVASVAVGVLLSLPFGGGVGKAAIVVLLILLGTTAPVASAMLGHRAHLGTTPAMRTVMLTLNTLATILVVAATIAALVVLATPTFTG